MAKSTLISNGIIFNENNHFREKCKMLKKIIKHNVFENAAICDEISDTQERLIITREECKFLTKKLKLFEPENGIPGRMNVGPPKVKKPTARKKAKINGTPGIINVCLNKVKKSTPRKKGNVNGTSSKSSVNPVLNIIKKSAQKKKGNINDIPSTITTNPTIVKKSSPIKKGNNNGNSSKINVNSTTAKKSVPIKKGNNKVIPAIENANPKTTVKKSAPRKKGTTNGMLSTVNTSMTKAKQSTPRKKGNVNGINKPKRPPANRSPASRKKISQQIPKPVIVGEVTIFNFGQIIYDSPSYYSDCAIYSVGYYATRTYAHFRNIYSKCTYHCKVLKGGPSPRFEIMDHDKHFKVTGLSTNECHNHLLSLINKMLVTDDLLFETDNGDRFFGLTLPLVRHRLQEKPESKFCTGYIPLQTKVDIQAEIAAENDPSMSFEGLHAWLSQYPTSH